MDLSHQYTGKSHDYLDYDFILSFFFRLRITKIRRIVKITNKKMEVMHKKKKGAGAGPCLYTGNV
jgi:hypothetical protein